MKATFSWGMSSAILFPGWPGESLLCYLLTLIALFVSCLVVEWLSHARLSLLSFTEVSAGLLQTAMYGGRVALVYFVMLAVMSFDVGVFVAAVSGYAVGFLLFGSRVFRKSQILPFQEPPDLPPFTC